MTEKSMEAVKPESVAPTQTTPDPEHQPLDDDTTQPPPKKQMLLYKFLQGFEVEGNKSEAKLGVMLGVFLPSIQNVFGVIMFLRLSCFVGMMGTPQAFLMTFLTSIAISAICTNGIMGRGGPYFLISRSLGAGFGAAVGLLFCMANTIAIAMYVIGGVEIILMHLAPGIALGGKESLEMTGFLEPMTNSQRLYGIALLFIIFLIVIAGVKFTQMLAPVSLLGVIIGVFFIYVGTIYRSTTNTGPFICKLEGRILKFDTFLPKDFERSQTSNYTAMCLQYCNVETPDSTLPIWTSYCVDKPDNIKKGTGKKCGTTLERTDVAGKKWTCLNIFNDEAKLECIRAVRGFRNEYAIDNRDSTYLKKGEVVAGEEACPRQNEKREMKNEVFQDLTSGFFVLLAIYFPSVTGIMTGANMSGDLRDPQDAIPRGTITAQLFTSLIYLSLVVVFGSTMDGDFLRDKYGHSLGGTMTAAWVAWPVPEVPAPRLLQSIAQDDAIPMLRPLAKLTKRNEPLRGQIALFVLAFFFTLIGKLDFIAPIVQMCFLSCYAGLNLSCFVNSVVGSPSWRPRFKSMCIILFFIIHIYTTFRGNRKEFGDSVGAPERGVTRQPLWQYITKQAKPCKAATESFTFHIRMQQTMAVNALFVPRQVQIRQVGGVSRMLTLCLNSDNQDLLFNWTGHLKRSKNSLTVYQTLSTLETPVAQRDELKQALNKYRIRLYVKNYCKTPFLCRQYYESIAFSNLARYTQCGKLKISTIACSLDDMKQYLALLLSLLMDAHGIVLTTNPTIDLPPYFSRPVQSFVDMWWILDGGDMMCELGQILCSKPVWSMCIFRLILVLPESEDLRYGEMKGILEQTLKRQYKKLERKKCQIRVRSIERDVAPPYFVGEAKRRAERLDAWVKHKLTNKEGGRSMQFAVDRVLNTVDMTNGKTIRTTKSPTKPQEQNIKLSQIYKTENSAELERMIAEESASSELVLITVPGVCPRSVRTASLLTDYMTSLSKSLKRTLFVKSPIPDASLW